MRATVPPPPTPPPPPPPPRKFLASVALPIIKEKDGRESRKGMLSVSEDRTSGLFMSVEVPVSRVPLVPDL